MRTPFQEERGADPASLRTQLAEGFRFLWSQPFLRTMAFLFGLTNFIGPGVMLAIVVIGQNDGLTGGEIGLLVSAFGASVLVGSLVSPFLRKRLSVRGILLLELWTWVGCGLFLVWPSVYVLAASVVPTGLAIPSTDSVVRSYELSLTPDRSSDGSTAFARRSRSRSRRSVRWPPDTCSTSRRSARPSRSSRRSG